MRIYFIDALTPTGYDSYDSFVVIAEDEISARQFCAGVAGDEGENTWLLESFSSCVAIGEAHADRWPGIVVSSFNAG